MAVGAHKVSLNYTNKIHQLPFQVRLKKFQIETHPGTVTPSGFRSTVMVHDKTDEGKSQKFEADIYMNHTLDHKGYRFFQSSYRVDQSAQAPSISIFSVVRDPGTPIFYMGCIVLCFGVLVIFFVKPSLIKIEKRRARIALGLPVDGPLTPKTATDGATES